MTLFIKFLFHLQIEWLSFFSFDVNFLFIHWFAHLCCWGFVLVLAVNAALLIKDEASKINKLTYLSVNLRKRFPSVCLHYKVFFSHSQTFEKYCLSESVWYIWINIITMYRITRFFPKHSCSVTGVNLHVGRNGLMLLSVWMWTERRILLVLGHSVSRHQDCGKHWGKKGDIWVEYISLNSTRKSFPQVSTLTTFYIMFWSTLCQDKSKMKGEKLEMKPLKCHSRLHILSSSITTLELV